MQCVDLGGRRIIKKEGFEGVGWAAGGAAAFFQAEDGIRDVERSRGLGDVYKRQGDNNENAIIHIGNQKIFFSRTT